MICPHCKGTGMAEFTQREKAIITMLIRGAKLHDISKHLQIKYSYLPAHLLKIYKKAQIDSKIYDPRVRLVYMVSHGEITDVVFKTTPKPKLQPKEQYNEKSQQMDNSNSSNGGASSTSTSARHTRVHSHR